MRTLPDTGPQGRHPPITMNRDAVSDNLIEVHDLDYSFGSRKIYKGLKLYKQQHKVSCTDIELRPDAKTFRVMVGVRSRSWRATNSTWILPQVMGFRFFETMTWKR